MAAAATALLVVDMVNDFIMPESPIHVPGAIGIIPSVIRAVEIARQRGMLVVWAMREHDKYGRDVELFRRPFYANGNGPVTKGTKGAHLVDGLEIEEADYKVVTSRMSAFFATNLHLVLQASGIKSLVVVGVQTPNCIRQTAFEAVSWDYQPVTVLTNATAAATPQIHAANLLDMRNIGIKTITLEEWAQL
ncbi:hypothetical protein ACLOJK_021190 [Asimina triloba]